MNYGLDNKIVLITGGSVGLGRTLINEFQAQNCTVIFGNRNEELGKKVEKETGAEFVKFDLSDIDSIKNIISYVSKKYGRIDILVNNAALCCNSQMPMAEFDDEYIKTSFTVNSLGTYKCMQEAIRVMLKQETKGTIVNITSITTVRGGAGVSVYASSKAAINSMTAAAANEYGSLGIHINAVMSGVIGTEGTKAFKETSPEHYKAFCSNIPLARVAEPEEIAKPVLWLCCKDSSYVQGHLLVVDGGCLI